MSAHGASPDDDVRELCRRLDGLPLAIELAAARIRMLSPSELLELLSERLDLLKGGRDAEPRQQTIRATIEWSHNLLSNAERDTFRRAAVFVGGWTLEAASVVLGVELELVESLFDKSLLRRSEEGRFFMLETIRQFAHERLEEAGELGEMRRRHADFMLRYAETALAEADRWDGARKLEPERENLRAAMRWTLDRRQTRASLVLSSAYALLCVYRGPLGEGRSWVAAALEVPQDEITTRERADALIAASSLAGRQRDLEPARTFAKEALALASGIDDSTGIARALVSVGIYFGVEGDYDRAEETLHEARAVAERAGDDRFVRESLSMLGWVALARRDYVKAREVIAEGLLLARRAGDARGIFYATGNLGHVAARQGRCDEALELMREALVVGLTQDVQSEADGLQELSSVAAALEHYEEAAVLLGAAEHLLEGAEAVEEEVASGVRHETLKSLRANLDEDRLSAARRRGRLMTLEQAVDFAVRLIDGISPS